MADYNSQQGGEFSRNYGQGSSMNRDAAFAHIFGGAPPGSGRSQTMTSSSMQPLPPGRAQTMSAQTTGMMQRAPPMRPPMNGYPPPAAPGFAQQPRSFSNPRPGPPPVRQPPVPYGAPPVRSPMPYPLNVPPRISPPGQPLSRPPMQGQGIQGQGVQGQGANRFYAGAPGPALNSDPLRSQSLASQPRQPVPPRDFGARAGPYNNISPAHAFRQQQYPNTLSRTTAQGRVVPERIDERTMSLTSYARDHEHNQIMSGRVIPNRKRASNEPIPDWTSHGTVASLPTSPSSPTTAQNQRARTTSQSSYGDRTMSMASTVVAHSERTDSLGKYANDMPKPEVQNQKVMAVQKRTPLVYPALLSRVANVFRERITLADLSKDGLDYKNAFTGEDAVTLIAYIIKTTDRNLALLLGRSLDAQKFFHDVTYAHRLRDLRTELYQFKESSMAEEQPEVNGVFTLLTECYSPTCTRDRLCYSIACPRRLEQQARLKMKPQSVLKREDSRQSLHEDTGEEQKLWINTVSKEIADSIDEREKKRQEVISELMYTERDFVKDMEYLRDFWIKPLQSPGSPIQEHRRKHFVLTVFSNLSEVYQVNSRLAAELTKRQNVQPVVRNIGDIFLEFVPRFSPFITYGASQLFGKYEFENEKRTNLNFSRFVDETERLKESRKLELNGYLTKPTTRLARYPLLLENILKYTAEGNPDRQDIPEAVKMIKDFLSKVNIESGKAENQFNLMQLSKELKFRPGEYVDLKLTDPHRQLLFKSNLKKAATDTNSDIQVYLFDHAVLIVRVKMVNKKEELKVYRKPIPLELLVINEMDQLLPKSGLGKRQSSGLMNTRTNTMTTQKANDAATKSWPLTFRHLGKGGYECTLFCSTPIQQQKWVEHVDAQQRILKERNNIFVKTILNEGYFTATIRVNCCVPIDGARKLVLGTDSGVFVTDRKPKDASQKPRRVLDCKNVTQLDVLEQHSIVLVLTEKTMYSYSMEALDPDDPQPQISKRGRKICHANFFRAGICQGQQLVCCVKTSGLSTTIKAYEPMDSMTKKSKKSGIAKMLQGSQDVLKPLKVDSPPPGRDDFVTFYTPVYDFCIKEEPVIPNLIRLPQEFYIPTESTSIHFLRSKLCVGCARGFEIVSLETLEAQSLLDQADTSLDFIQRKENIKPIHIERIATEFLLCYTDYSFFVNRNGWRARPDWIIEWEGTPQAFAIFNPYILAFEPNFIEIRHMDNGHLVHIITAKNIRMLHSSSREILYAYEDELGEDVIASLDFWGRPQSPGSHVEPEQNPAHHHQHHPSGHHHPRPLENGGLAAGGGFTRKEYGA